MPSTVFPATTRSSHLASVGGNSFYTQLTAVTNPDGSPLFKSDLNSGFYAQAFNDGYGDIIIAFEGSYPIPDPFSQKSLSTYANASRIADIQLASGSPPTALTEAEQFAEQVYQTAKVEFPSAQIFVTGHSLGGTEAEAAAKYIYDNNNGVQVGGVTFAATGLPGNSSVGSDSALIDYIDSGDPVGNYATDTSTYSWTGYHYGNVEHVELVYLTFHRRDLECASKCG